MPLAYFTNFLKIFFKKGEIDMKFNFKEALEYARTPEGKAEYFLKETLKVIKKMSPFDELTFKLTSAMSSKQAAPYSIFSIAQNGNILYKLHPIQDYDEAIAIFYAIESQLEREGFSLEPSNGKCQIMKHFSIKI